MNIQVCTIRGFLEKDQTRGLDILINQSENFRNNNSGSFLWVSYSKKLNENRN